MFATLCSPSLLSHSYILQYLYNSLLEFMKSHDYLYCKWITSLYHENYEVLTNLMFTFSFDIYFDTSISDLSLTPLASCPHASYPLYLT